MAKRKAKTARAHAGSAGDSMEQRITAFAEQLGRIAGTAQAHDLVLVTNNTRHFASLGVPLENWKQG